MGIPGEVKFSRIILAVDGSESSKAASTFISTLQIPDSCRICIIAVLDTPHTPRRQLLLAALEDACEALKKQYTDIECGLLHGHPAAEIIDFANDYEPDVIILGSKGLRATLGIFLGGVSQQVVEHAHWPVLIVRPISQFSNRFLIAVDGSSYSQAALNYAQKFLPLSGGEYHLVHVVSPIPAYDAGKLPRTWQIGTDIFHTPPIDYTQDVDEWKKIYEDKGRIILDNGTEILKNAGIDASSTLLHGDAATEIIEYANQNKIDLIIFGSRGLSEISGWLLGSVSRKLVHYAQGSVLIVKQIPEI